MPVLSGRVPMRRMTATATFFVTALLFTAAAFGQTNTTLPEVGIYHGHMVDFSSTNKAAGTVADPHIRVVSAEIKENAGIVIIDGTRHELVVMGAPVRQQLLLSEVGGDADPETVTIEVHGNEVHLAVVGSKLMAQIFRN